jgi:hypothetical protein
MSLDTVLQIGKVLRHSDDSLKYFKYVEPCPQDPKTKEWPTCITIPVKEDFSFDWEGIEITPEKDRKKLYYLKFKTSDADVFVKYIFGDLYYSKTAKIKKDGIIEISEGGYYRLENPNHTQAGFRPSSFNRGNDDYEDIVKDYKNGTVFNAFREILKNNLKIIEAILNYLPAVTEYIESNPKYNFLNTINDVQKLYDSIVLKNYNLYKKKLDLKELAELGDTDRKRLFDLSNYSVFIHFEFPENKQWYQFSDEMNLITGKILSEFVDNNGKGQVLKKTLYKTLCSGDTKNDIQFPMFTNLNKHKAKIFTNDELQDLFYAIDYTSKGKQITGTDIKLIVLPCGNNLSAKDYETFRVKRDENRIVAINNNDNQGDMLFHFALDDNIDITTFDLIFCKKGGLTSPDSDLIEISGIEKSKLRLIMERIRKISREVELDRKNFIKTDRDLFPLKIDYSFCSILGNPQYDEKKKKVSFKANPKYQSHLLKVLPLIYTENYFQDEVLLPAFVQNVEFSIRVGDSNFSFLKYNLKFLLKIQNTKNDIFMEITSSESYQIGFLLGGMAKNLSMEINSFEKNYVGNLTRRIGTLSDFVKLKNEVEQKLIMHDKAKFTFQTSYDLAQKVKEFTSRYDKEECAFGFMESYFKPLPKKEAGTTNDTIITSNQ